MSFPEITSLAGILGLILTLLLMASQTRKLVVQTRIANAAAHLGAHYDALERLHDLNRILLETPKLQPYFLLCAECNPGDPDYDSARLLADMFADVFDLGLELHRRIGDEVHRDCWDSTVMDALQQPILKQTITSGATWWPELRLFVQQRPEVINSAAKSQIEVGKVEAAPPKDGPPSDPSASSPSSRQ